jgi:predicted phosphohydrolase
MNETEFFAALISWMNCRYPGLAVVMDGNPDKWLDPIRRIRALCEEIKIYNEDQFPYVVANLFSSAERK